MKFLMSHKTYYKVVQFSRVNLSFFFYRGPRQEFERAEEKDVFLPYHSHPDKYEVVSHCSFFFLFFWPHWVFLAVHRLSLVGASRGSSLLLCAAFSLWWLLVAE